MSSQPCLWCQPATVLRFSVGDAVCTISAATCFPEPFINEGKRLGYVHRNFAGNRFSDHVALLSVFQAWDDARCELRGSCKLWVHSAWFLALCRALACNISHFS